jgi:hypothetical protein
VYQVEDEVLTVLVLTNQETSRARSLAEMRGLGSALTRSMPESLGWGIPRISSI